MEPADLVQSSISVLRSLQTPQGGFLSTYHYDAYPYVYIRDAIFMAKAMDLLGHHRPAERFYEFLFRIQAKAGSWRQRYSADGMPHISRPRETDVMGLALHGIFVHYKITQDKRFPRKYWPSIRRGIAHLRDMTEAGLITSLHSVHEYKRLEAGYEIWCNCACVRGLANIAKIAAELGMEKEAEKLRKWAYDLRLAVLQRFWDPRHKIWAKCIKEEGFLIESPDISQIAPLYFNLTRRHPQILQKIYKILWYNKLGGILRFRKFEGCTDWHWYTGGHGPWTVFTLQLARTAHRFGMRSLTKRCLDWVHKIQLRGWLPEHIAMRSEYEEWAAHERRLSSRVKQGIARARAISPPKVMYWATPLGWAHAEYLLTMLELGKIKPVIKWRFDELWI
jgi:GH15 family glucan-1,4-alpha-glucosidase